MPWVDLVKLQRQHAGRLKAINEDIAKNNERNAERQRHAYYSIADDIGSALNSIFGESKM